MKQASKDLHLLKANQLKPFLSMAKRYSAPIEKIATAVGLPLHAIDNDDALVGEYSAWAFIEEVAKFLKNPHFGFECAEQFPVESVEGLGGYRMTLAPSLYLLLEYFFEGVQSESSTCFYRLDRNKEEPSHYLIREPAFGLSHPNWQTEQYMLLVFIQIIRLAAGEHWLPKRISIYSHKEPVSLPNAWATIDITWGASYTAVEISNDVLAMSPKNERQATTADEDRDLKLGSLNIENYLESHVRSGRISQELAASEFGMSLATFKRKLAKLGLSYAESVENIRVRMAKEMLLGSSMGMQEISDNLGYLHQSNFSRAFQRATSVSPKQFRDNFTIPTKN
ncbi:helix-turn-helix domain-containing protein [Agaribacterium sp. ZY112]|uniref:helix-turn-helix transcriptional regulator n=1 Tax=Agaribacterium sp. ZY112 TaxID=3233574 RepID=UPI003523EB0F